MKPAKQFAIVLLVGTAILIYYGHKYLKISLSNVPSIRMDQSHAEKSYEQGLKWTSNIEYQISKTLFSGVTTTLRKISISSSYFTSIQRSDSNANHMRITNVMSNSYTTAAYDTLNSISGSMLTDVSIPIISTTTSDPAPSISHQTFQSTPNPIANKKCMDMTQTVLNRIDYLQNPNNCSTARKVICGRAGAGMGSTVHHWVYCLIYAYYTNRTMIIDATQWLYLKNIISKDGVNDFHDLFQSISKCKYTVQDKKIAVSWNNQSLDSTDASKTPQVIRLETLGILDRDLKVMPTTCHHAMPTDIFYDIIKSKYKPMAWWIGVLSQFIIRPNSYLQQFIDESRKQFQFQSPIVGVHIRRTDKREESKLFNIDQYMTKVKAFFDNLAKRKINIKRRIFVTTDEPHLIPQLKSKYANYQFIHPPLQQLRAGTHSTRYSALNLKHFMRDLFLLAECDYLVVTMSSNVGRLVYELHEAIYSRTQSQHYVSLDDDFYVYGHAQTKQGPWIMQANQDYHSNASKGFNLIKGDILDSCVWLNKTHNLYSCYSQRLKKSGSIPGSCVSYLLDYDTTYPDYSKIDKSLHSNKSYQQSNHNIQNICTKSSINDIQL